MSGVVAIDTAGPVVGVAVLHGERVASRTERVARGAEQRLVPWAVELCEALGLPLADLDGVAVTDGPGAFTGLRVGLATAAGLALSLGRPVWTTSSLASRAARVEASELPLLVLLDARKQRVYASLYEQGRPARGPADVPPEEALSWLEGRPFQATGEGALVYRDRVEAAGGAVLPRADDPAIEALARLAAAGLARGEGTDPAAVVPRYLRAPDAKPPRR